MIMNISALASCRSYASALKHLETRNDGEKGVFLASF